MSKLDRSEEMASKNVVTESKSSFQQNQNDDVVRECPLNGGLKKSKGKRKKSTSLRLKFSRKHNDASNPKDLVGLGMYVDFDFNNKNITRITHSYRKRSFTQKSTLECIMTKILKHVGTRTAYGRRIRSRRFHTSSPIPDTTKERRIRRVDWKIWELRVT